MKTIYDLLPTEKTPIAIALDFLEDPEIGILHRFSRIIEAEWEKSQGVTA